MKISAVKPSSQENISSKQPSLDSHESELRKQITTLREQKKSISYDNEKTSEEKKKEKQAVQEEIQSLSSELRQYQIQKRQEEAAKKREAMKEAAQEKEDRDKTVEEEQIPTAMFGNEESGVLISLSAARKQIRGMNRTLNTLKRKQGTAVTEEEKDDFQKKINNAAKNIGRKITITEDNMVKVSNINKKKGAKARQQISDQPFDWKRQPEIITAADDPEEYHGGNLIANRKKFFSTVSIFIR